MFEFIKFIPFNSLIDSNEYSFDLNSDIKSDKETNNSQPSREKECNILFGEEKLISSEKEENLSDNSWIISEFSPMNIYSIDLFEISKNIFPNNQEESMKNRGRKKRKNFDKPVHKSSDFDNVQRKIKVHFLTFLIDFCNDALKTEYAFFPYTFKHINYKNKMTVNFKQTKEIKKSSIKDILNMEISLKYSTCNIFENKNILLGIKSIWLNSLFVMNYMDLFIIYYNQGKPLHKITFEKKEIILSPKTKSFYYLLQKKQNQNLQKNLIETAKMVYLSDYDTKISPFSKFVISSDEKK